MVAMAVAPSEEKPGSATREQDILREALERYQACHDWQSTEDERSRQDIKFANGDSRNAWQWDERAYQRRDGQEKPCLTINNTRVHNDMVINQLSKSDFGIRVRPTAGKASYASAQIMQRLVQRTENISRFTTQRRKIAEHQVDGGIGYALLETRYISERSFDQDVFVRAAQDPTGVFLDPWIKDPDGLDANFGFVFERIPRKEFNRKYPQWRNRVGQTPMQQTDMTAWISDKEIMLAKYYRKRANRDTLVSYTDNEGEHEKLVSEIKDEAGKIIFDALIADIEDGKVEGRTRKVSNDKVEWFLIAGDTVVEKGEWAGRYIPICRCVGRETVIDGKLDRKGHTRPLIDAQRMLNYNASTSVEVTALSPKSQWLGPARAFEGQEQWKDANVENYAFLQYNDIDEEAPQGAQEISPPQRIDPPRTSPAHLQGMQDAERQMMMISGQFQAQMGENDTQSAASGKAINERQEQGDVATYHFPEHQADMLRAIGTQLLDLYPKIYDTKRALHVLGEDGEKHWIQIDPDQSDAVQELQKEGDDEEALRMSFNPSIGEYECVSDPGPDYATQRQRAWDAGTAILQANRELAGVVGDLLFKNGDFPGADEMAERLKKEIKALKPYLFDEKADPQVTAMQQQMQRLTAMNSELMQKLALKELALKGKDEKRDIDASRAETERLKMMIEFIVNTQLSDKDKAQMEHDIMSRSHDASMQMIVDSNAAEIQSQGDPDNKAAIQ